MSVINTWDTKVREINVAGFDIEVHRFTNSAFFYPKFNGNAEFKVNRKGFRRLSSYLRTINWMERMFKPLAVYSENENRIVDIKTLKPLL